jgi:hypothetical protein
MRFKIHYLFFGLSLLFNFLFVMLFVISGSSKNSSVSFYNPDGYITAAAVLSVPKTRSAAVDRISLNLKLYDTAYIQFSVFSGQVKNGRQVNLIFNPLFDPNIVSVTQTGSGFEITALREGSTLIQSFTNDGIIDVALVNITE